ncbi:MAG TPA: peptidoglycan DD-metalloendopeptidase family protein [bacterium]|nr:peptidoglycan DD-metalloendopeptidase family protein [bacterium]
MTRLSAPLARAVAITLVAGTLSGVGGSAPGAVILPTARSSTAPAVPGRPWQTPSVLVPVGAQVAGTVLRVDVGDRRYVSAGTVLLELDPRGYRTALEQARARAAALAARARDAQAQLTAGRRQAAAGVTAVVGSAATMPPLPAPAPIVVPVLDAATKAQLAQAQQQILAARSDVESGAASEAASACDTVSRDRALLAQGLIAQRQLDADMAACTAAQAQVAAARAALRSARAGTPLAGGGSVGQAQAAIAAAQRNVGTAQADAAAATRAVERDAALAAQGALAVRRITADTVVQDAARARLQAATAELHRAQAELTAAQAQAAAAGAVRRQAEVIRRAEVARAQHAAETRVLAQRAASTIITAEQGARALAALETGAVNVENAVRRAEANLAGTQVRAPADGWVVQPIVRPGDAIRQGQSVAMLAVDARHRTDAAVAAASTKAKAAFAAGSPAGGADPASLAQITANERQVLAELANEAQRISSISAAGIPEMLPPGTSLPALPYGGADPLNQASGTVPTLLNGGMPWPVVGAITSGYGWRIHPIFDTPEFHTGVDIAASMGTAIGAPEAGTVIFAGSLPANGTLVILDHGNGVTTTYSHLSSYRVYVGERVQRGQVIALVGSTGWSTGPHLFFEIRKNGRPINPLSQ